MCYFLFVATAEAETHRIKEVFARGFKVHETTNPSVLRAMPPGYVTRTITSHGCSCDLISDGRSGLRRDVVNGMQKLCSDAGGVAIVMHHFNGDVDNERFSIVKSACDHASLSDRLAALRENELLVFKPATNS
jgi:hypothetical protein